MDTYAMEYQNLISSLTQVMKKFKGYRGTEEHIQVLDSCIEQGKKYYIQRNILASETINKHFSLCRDMIIRRKQARDAIIYLEKCIEKEKDFITTSFLEESVFKIMSDSVNSFNESQNGLGKEELLGNITEETCGQMKGILKLLEENQLSYNIHHDHLVTAAKIALDSIEVQENNGGKIRNEAIG